MKPDVSKNVAVKHNPVTQCSHEVIFGSPVEFLDSPSLSSITTSELRQPPAA
jgi:hypothetical protein